MTPEQIEAARSDAAGDGNDREQHAEPRRRRPPAPAAARDEGLHAEAGRAAAAADPSDRRRAARRGRASPRDGSVGRLRVPAADHRDRRAPRSSHRATRIGSRSGPTRSSRRRSTRRTWSGSSSRWASSSATWPTSSRSGAPRPRDDLVSALLAARDESDALSEQEVFGTVVMLIVAGHETTVGLIGNAVLNLLEHPDQLALLHAGPDAHSAARSRRSSATRARWSGALNRWAATDVELGGQTIRKGDLVIPILTAAGRDPTRFPRARPARRDPGGHTTPRLRSGQSLLPRRAAGSARGRDRARDALPAPPGAATRGASRPARMAPDARFSPRRRAAGGLVAATRAPRRASGHREP